MTAGVPPRLWLFAGAIARKKAGAQPRHGNAFYGAAMGQFCPRRCIEL